MPWDPTTDLTEAHVSGLAIEETCLNLWQEYLGGYFTGGNHSVNGEAVNFPLAVSSFQQGNIPQPLNGVSISLTWLKQTQPKRREDGQQRIAYHKVSWNFWLRAKGQNQGQGGPAVQVRKASDCLYAVLSNKGTTLALARKGIQKIRAFNATVVNNSEYQMRSMIVEATLRYVLQG